MLCSQPWPPPPPSQPQSSFTGFGITHPASSAAIPLALLAFLLSSECCSAGESATGWQASLVGSAGGLTYCYR